MNSFTDMELIRQAADVIANRKKMLIFTGAGISIESGIPAFRGENGLWNVVDPSFIEIDHYMAHTRASWRKIKEIFYDHFGQAKPNPAHFACAELQKMGVAFALVTQNIDGLHQAAGSTDVVEYHGTLARLICPRCMNTVAASADVLAPEIPLCRNCNSALKPDIVFYGEGIPTSENRKAYAAAAQAQVVLVCGTTGEVMPACDIPYEAHDHGAFIIEVNPADSAFTHRITDVHLKGKAGEVMPLLVDEVKKRLAVQA